MLPGVGHYQILMSCACMVAMPSPTTHALAHLYVVREAGLLQPGSGVDGVA
jgi:hypothetical protein